MHSGTSEGEPWAVEETGQPARLIAVRQRPAAGIGDPCVGNILRRHLIEAVDVLGTHQSAQLDHLVTLVQTQKLYNLHDQDAADPQCVNHPRNRAAQRVMLFAADRAIEVPVCRSCTAKNLEVTVEQGRYAYAQDAFLADTGSGAITRLGRLFQ